MKTIKIIELLNKIANDEDVPQEIRYNGDKYSKKYDKIENCYYYDGLYNTLSNIIYLDSSGLNDEIEIIGDDEKKIEKIGKGHYIDDEEVLEKIDEIIDYINNNHIPRID